jgi:Type III restriction enzyme, res subunit/Helicase C-terminal domain
MIKFRTSGSEESKPESIVLMFRDLNRDPSVKFLYSHQDKILEQYYDNHLNSQDVAIELPTGTGKTLVGLLIAEYRRRAFKERVVFLCPTKQLCFQAADRAARYGINTSLLIGSQRLYNKSELLKYQQGKSIAITTYSGIFNINPSIDSPNVIICDDAHAADNYIASLWTVSIYSYKHASLYTKLYRNIKECVPNNLRFCIDFNQNKYQSSDIDLISNISLSNHNKFSHIHELIEAFAGDDNDLKYCWSSISQHLEACLFYISPEKIEIRPLIPPTQNHLPFSRASQRIYMSATLGEDGDIERIFGVKKIARIPIPEKWDKRSTGRRLILFPEFSDNDSNSSSSLNVSLKMISSVPRALIITTDDKAISSWEKELSNTHEIIKSEKIEQSMNDFTKSQKPSILLLATRYDGIDLPGDECRLMLIDGKPSASGLQEKYFLTRLGAVSQLKNRIRTRITQAMGRCTRDESDYSVVIIYGNDLTKWLCSSDNTKAMHPEIQAEISFGLNNSEELSAEDFTELVRAFLSKSTEWQDAEQYIRKQINNFQKTPDSDKRYLASSMPHEIDYIYNSWQSKHDEALHSAIQVLSALEGGSEIKPYRAFWQYQAASSAFLAWKMSGNSSFKNAAIEHLGAASKISPYITWLGKLRSELLGDNTQEIINLPIQDCFMEISQLLEEWKIRSSKYDRKIDSFLENIRLSQGVKKDAEKFEEALQTLGKMLGARTHLWKKEEKGTPDGLWIFGSWCSFVFEAKTNQLPGRAISLDTLRQADTHKSRAIADKLIPDYLHCFTVVISSRKTIAEEAYKLEEAKNIFHISHNEIIRIAEDCTEALGKIRSIATSNSEEVIRENMLKEYTIKNVSVEKIKQRLTATRLNDLSSTQ